MSADRHTCTCPTDVDYESPYCRHHWELSPDPDYKPCPECDWLVPVDDDGPQHHDPDRCPHGPGYLTSWED